MVLNYTVKFSDEGLKRFERLDGRVKKKVIKKVGLLGDFKLLNTIKKMEGRDKDYYRMRVGDIRILFRVREGEKTIWVTDIGFRGSIYR